MNVNEYLCIFILKQIQFIKINSLKNINLGIGITVIIEFNNNYKSWLF